MLQGCISSTRDTPYWRSQPNWTVVDYNDNQVCSYLEIDDKWKDEALKRGLSCIDSNYANRKRVKVNTKLKNTSNFSKQKTNTLKEPNNIVTNTSDTCSILQNKILSHIKKNQYQQASNARKLMKEMNFAGGVGQSSSLQRNSNSNAKQNYSTSKQVSKYSQDELKCSVGPLGKYMFREYGYYSVVAFDNNPSKGCNATYQYCKSRARAIAKGAKITPSEKSPSSYSADCSIYGTNKYNTTANCSLTPDSGGGGFAGVFANELGKGIERASAMKRIYVSNFEICMSEMGYSLLQK